MYIIHDNLHLADKHRFTPYFLQEILKKLHRMHRKYVKLKIYKMFKYSLKQLITKQPLLLDFLVIIVYFVMNFYNFMSFV